MGSTDTLGHTCDSMPAVMFLSSLCLGIGKSPQLQLRACSTLNCFPHAQAVGNLSGFHPYLRHSLSQNAPLWRLNPCSTMFRRRLSLRTGSLLIFCCSSKACASRLASSSITLLFFAFTSFLACSWFAFISLLYVGSFLIMCSIRGCMQSAICNLIGVWGSPYSAKIHIVTRPTLRAL